MCREGRRDSRYYHARPHRIIVIPLIWKLVVGAVLPALLLACSPGSSKRAPSPEQLGNITYHAVLDEPVTLQDGVYEGSPYSNMSVSRPTVTLIESTMAFGDVAGDDTDEAIVLLATNTGGSGVFFHLAVVRNQGGVPQHIGTIPLGDRVKVKTLAIIDRKIVASLVEHGPGDPMCCPMLAVYREWKLQDGKFAELDTKYKQPDTRHRGYLAWGHEERSFTGCGTERTGWVINDSGEDLIDVYEELTSSPYEPLFVEVSGNWTDAPEQGFGADYPEAMRITEWHRAEREGRACDLELENVMFIAMGNEPSWHVEIRRDGISMRSLAAPDEVRFPAPEATEAGERVSFKSTGAEPVIDVILERGRCADSMSGTRYEYVATVELEDKRLSGCAIKGYQ